MSEEKPKYHSRFKQGNKAAKKNPKVVLRKFNEILKNAQTKDDILSWQKACLSIGWRVTKCDYWAEKNIVFGNIKKEVMQIIIARVNDGALKGEFAGAASIWRMKQSGEVDQSTINQNHSIGEGSVNIDKWIENNAD